MDSRWGMEAQAEQSPAAAAAAAPRGLAAAMRGHVVCGVTAAAAAGAAPSLR